MKIAIQPTPIGFTKYWIDYCMKNNVDYKLVDCYRNDILDQVEDCDALMWHHDLLLSKDNLVAKRLFFALEHSGKLVFPNFYEGWHYDDKIAQKYLLEALKIPFITTYIFYDKKEALQWANKTVYPKVFKLKGGAGSSNVSLVKSKSQATKIIRKAFNGGFSPVKKSYFLKERVRRFKKGESNLFNLVKAYIRYLLPLDKGFTNEKDKGYVYFQEFIPNNENDLRIVVIDQNKVFGIKRFNRENDFRASGSGVIEYLDESNAPMDCLKIALDTAKKLKMDCIAYDFVYDEHNSPLIIEITYSFGSKVSKAAGYWDNNLVWHKGEIKMQDWMIENLISKIKSKN